MKLKRIFTHYYKSIGTKLFIFIFGTIIVIFVLFASVSIRRSSQEWMASLEEHATRTSSIIESAIRYGMMLNNKDDVHNTLRNIVSGHGISAIRIYDKEGTIIFSTVDREINQHVDMQDQKCVICHEQDQPLRSVPHEKRSRIFRDANGLMTLGLIHPIENSNQCSMADCHEHPSEKHILGVLDLIMPIDFIEKNKMKAERETKYMAFIMALILGLLTADFINRFVRVPVKRLTDGTQRITQGDLDTHIIVKTSDELGDLAHAFNTMTRSLSTAKENNERWELELEQRIEEKTRELGKVQHHMAHLEKMASLGKLAATVAHEINNPLAGILVYAKLVARELKEQKEKLPEDSELLRYLDVIYQETERCGGIVKNLLSFARQPEGMPIQQHFYPLIERSLQIVNHHFELGGIEVKLNKEGSDEIYCNANQIQQAMIALFVNAVEAMPDGGSMKVTLTNDEDFVKLAITDTGIGIPPETLPNIFEPFVSTKGETKGVGLGLAVVYGIAHGHGGDITVQSEVGKGTTFTLKIPRWAPKEQRAQPI